MLSINDVPAGETALPSDPAALGKMQVQASIPSVVIARLEYSIVQRLFYGSLLIPWLCGCAAEDTAVQGPARGMLDVDESALSQPTYEVLVERDIRPGSCIRI